MHLPTKFKIGGSPFRGKVVEPSPEKVRFTDPELLVELEAQVTKLNQKIEEIEILMRKKDTQLAELKQSKMIELEKTPENTANTNEKKPSLRKNFANVEYFQTEEVELLPDGSTGAIITQ